jgi:hypothetical protein
MSSLDKKLNRERDDERRYSLAPIAQMQVLAAVELLFDKYQLFFCEDNFCLI